MLYGYFVHIVGSRLFIKKVRLSRHRIYMKRIGYLLVLAASSFIDCGISFRGKSSFIHVASGSLLLNTALSGVNGTIIRDSHGTISGESVTFAHGVLQDEQNDLIMSAVYSPAGQLLLNGDKHLEGDGGVIQQQIIVSGTGNIIEGSFVLQSDIVVQDSSTTLSVAVQSALNKNILMQGGALYLNDDILFADSASITGSGEIYSNGYRIVIGCHCYAGTSTLQFVDDASIYLNGDVEFLGSWNMSGTCSINGQGHVLDLSHGGTLTIDANSTLILENIKLYGVHSGNIVLTNDTSTLQIDTVKCIQDGNYTFDKGSILFIGNSDFCGTYTFSYESSQTSTIAINSQWTISNDMTLKIGRKMAADSVEPLAFVDGTSSLKCDESTVLIADYGAQFTKGRLIFAGESTLDIMGTTTSTGMISGNGEAKDDFVLFFDASASMNFVRGFYIYNNAGTDGLKVASKSATVIRYPESKVYITHDWTLPPWILRVAPGGAPYTEVAPGVSFSYNNTNLIFPDVEMDLTAYQSDSITFLLSGDNFVYLSKGSFGLPMMVSGINNEVRGNGIIIFPITMSDSSTKLTFGLRGQVRANVILNGGSILLSSNLSLANGAIFSGVGLVDLSTNAIDLGATDSIWTSTIEWQGEDGIIQLGATTELMGSWTIQGTCIINGNGNTLDLDGTGNIIIAPESRLVLRNLYLKNISQDCITCVDDSGVLELDNILWSQNDDVVFNHGCMEFINEVVFGGAYTFTYDSSQTCTIHGNSKWLLRDFMTLAIGREDSGQTTEPIFFKDITSILEFDNANLRIIKNGARITNGTFVFNKDVSIDIISTSTENGFEVGDGVTEHDPVLQINPGAVVNFLGGDFTYNISNSTNIKASSNTACLMRQAGSNFFVKQSLTLPEVTIKADSETTMSVDSGQQLCYGNCVFEDDHSEYSLQGFRLSAIGTLLSGNGRIFITRGVMPALTVVSGTNNYLIGNGSVSGPIMLSDSGAQLNWGVEGALSADITFDGGTMTLDRDLYLIQGAVFAGQGSVNLGSFSVKTASDSVWTSTIEWIGVDAVIECRDNIDLSGTWTFQGSCSIEGQGNIIDLSSGGSIVVSDDTQLTIRNAIIHGLQDTQIRCLGSNSSLTLNDVYIVLDDDYTFSVGSISFKNTVEIIAFDSSFVYQSDQTSTVQLNSQLILDEGITFSYDPRSSSAELLAFIDKSAELHLAGGSLYITTTDMHITNGTIKVLQNSTVKTDNQAGIILGNDTDAHDAHLYISTGTSFKIQGIMQYRNVNTSSLTLVNDRSRLIFLDNATLYLYETMSLGLGIIEFYENTTLAYLSGKEIDGSTFGFGTLNFVPIA